MDRRYLLSVVVTVAVSSLATEWTSAQQPEGRGGGVQVGVPQGRGGPGGRGRQAGPPPGPAPRSRGRILLGERRRKGRGSGGGAQMTAGDRHPFQLCGQSAPNRRQSAQALGAKPPGSTRQFLTPYGVKVRHFRDPDLYWHRRAHTDASPHRCRTRPTSIRAYGLHRLVGDTLASTVGFNEGFWMDGEAPPHTEKLHTLERFTRTDSATIN